MANNAHDIQITIFNSIRHAMEWYARRCAVMATKYEVQEATTDDGLSLSTMLWRQPSMIKNASEIRSGDRITDPYDGTVHRVKAVGKLPSGRFAIETDSAEHTYTFTDERCMGEHEFEVRSL